jgi:PKD repeat protein
MIKRNSFWTSAFVASVMVAGLLWVGCSTETPTAPRQNATYPVQTPAQANFSCAILSDGMTIQFVNLSTGFVKSVLWDFGDGSNTSNEVNPVHTYAGAGPFIVVLQVKGGGATSAVQGAVPDVCSSAGGASS